MTDRKLLPLHADHLDATAPDFDRSTSACQADHVAACLQQAQPGRTGIRGRKASAGFTLIEVLIVVAIIGILAAIGYPSYAEYVKKTRRSDAHLALLSAAQSMERCKSTNYAYTNCTPTPTISPEGFYSIELDGTATATAFTLKATPPTGSLQANDTDCPKLTLNSRGQKGASTGEGDTATDMASTCW